MLTMEAFEIIWYIALGMIIIASSILNTALFKYTLRKSPLKFKERATISLSISEFLRAFVGYSIELSMLAFNKQKHTICVSFGFLIPFFSYTAIFLLTGLTFERWMKIKRSSRHDELETSATKNYLAIGFCWLLALILSGMPLVRLGAYDLEQGKMRCSVIWKSTSTSNTTYVIILFVFAFIVPLLIMAISFIAVQRIIRASRIAAIDLLEVDSASAVIQMRYKAERRNASIFFIVTFFFLLAWTPYAVICFIAAFGSRVRVPEIVNAIAVLPAKASAMQSPLIIACYEKNFRLFLKRFLRCGATRIQPRPTASHQVETIPMTIRVPKLADTISGL